MFGKTPPYKEPPKPVVSVNEFPRRRSNQLHSPVSNPHSAHMQYIQEQTYTTNTPSRIKTPLMPPLEASSYDAIELRDRILGELLFYVHLLVCSLLKQVGLKRDCFLFCFTFSGLTRCCINSLDNNINLKVSAGLRL